MLTSIQCKEINASLKLTLRMHSSQVLKTKGKPGKKKNPNKKNASVALGYKTPPAVVLTYYYAT